MKKGARPHGPAPVKKKAVYEKHYANIILEKTVVKRWIRKSAEVVGHVRTSLEKGGVCSLG